MLEDGSVRGRGVYWLGAGAWGSGFVMLESGSGKRRVRMRDLEKKEEKGCSVASIVL